MTRSRTLHAGGRARHRPLTANRVLALLFVASAARCFFAASARPAFPGTPALAATGAVAMAAAGATYVRSRQRPVLQHGQVLVLIAVTTLLVCAATNRGDAILRSLAYPWTALFAAVFMPRRAAYALAGLASLAFGAAIAVRDQQNMRLAWLFVTSTVFVLTAVTSNLVEALRLQSETDPLTGVANRAGFDRLARHALATAARHHQPVALVLCDLDGLKRLNDSEGHAAGDALLADVARAWTATLRGCDVIARLGGDEFGILLPETDGTGADAAVARLTAVTDAEFSAGIAVCAPGEALDDVLRRADAAMYERKKGRSAHRMSVPAQRRGPADVVSGPSRCAVR